jgi:hypothetical protein
MFTKFLEHIYNEHSFTLSNTKLLLRTDVKTSYFYLKHPTITNLFTNKKYIYLGTNDKYYWEYEDLYDINVDSCFE